jgi:stage II sporulation protein M
MPAVWLALGFAAGIAAAAAISAAAHASVSAYLQLFISGYSQSSKTQIFYSSVFKYGKYAVGIWLSGFVPFGAVLSAALLGARGAGLGFTSALLVKNYGLTGVAYAGMLCLPQNLILIPGLLFLCRVCAQRAGTMKDTGRGGTARGVSTRSVSAPQRLTEYIAALLVCAACVAAACFIEAFVVPGLVVL